VVPQPRPVGVLLVSDDDRVLDGLRRPLERSGEVAVVGTAKIDGDIAELVRQASPDVILLDVHPGDEDALALCQRLSQHAPVLLLSAYLTRTEWEEARAAGAADFHLKRIGVADLVEKVGAVRARDTRAPRTS
jgi:DNA-binding NarL/FixJ family response regulator